MKILYTTLLLAIVILISSCKSQDQKLTEFYRDVNNQMKKDNYLIPSNTRTRYTDPNEDSKSINYSAESAYMAQVKSKYEHYKVKYDDSEYANGDIYVQAAKRRQALIDQANKDCPDCQKKTAAATATNTQPAVSRVTQPATTTSTTPSFNASATGDRKTPDFFAHLLDTDKKLIRTEGISYINTEDKSKLKKYSVIIASLARSEGVERLKKAFGSKETLTIVRNDAGLYYVIIGSFDTEGQAAEKIRTVEAQYTRQYSRDQLLKTYGIPLTDMWILRK